MVTNPIAESICILHDDPQYVLHQLLYFNIRPDDLLGVEYDRSAIVAESSIPVPSIVL